MRRFLCLWLVLALCVAVAQYLTQPWAGAAAFDPGPVRGACATYFNNPARPAEEVRPNYWPPGLRCSLHGAHGLRYTALVTASPAAWFWLSATSLALTVIPALMAGAAMAGADAIRRQRVPPSQRRNIVRIG